MRNSSLKGVRSLTKLKKQNGEKKIEFRALNYFNYKNMRIWSKVKNKNWDFHSKNSRKLKKISFENTKKMLQ